MPNRGPAFTQRCWVPGCRHNKLEDRQNLTISFFRFPSGNVARCRAWLKVLGLEPFLTLSPRQLNNKFICEEHFRDYELRRYKLKTTLVTSAIPSKVPSGVCPLPDELVEQWPPLKENESAEEEVNLSVSQLQSPLSMSTPGPLRELGSNVSHQMLPAGVEPGGSLVLAIAVPCEHVSQSHSSTFPLDHSYTANWEILDYVIQRSKIDKTIRAVPAKVEYLSPHSAILVQ